MNEKLDNPYNSENDINVLLDMNRVLQVVSEETESLIEC